MKKMVFHYIDYRNFLKEEFQIRHARNRKFSQRAFANYLGISTGQLNQVMLRKKRLSQEKAIQIATVLKLKKKEKEYFCRLVLLDQAATLEEREFHLQKIRELRPNITFSDLDPDQFKTLSDWHHIVVLEMTSRDDFKADPGWIAQKIGRSEKETGSILERLERIGLIEKKEGTWEKTQKYLSICTQGRDEALRHFHRQCMEKAIGSIASQSNEEKDLSTVTFSIDPKKLAEAKEEIKEFRRRMAEFLTSGEQLETYQMVIALFRATQENEP